MQFAKILATLCLCAGLASADPIALKQPCEVRSTPVFSPGGQYLLVGAGTPKAAVWNLWDVPKGQLVRTFRAPPAAETYGIEPASASFSQDGKIFEQTGGKVLASWPRLWGHKIDPKGNMMAVVTDQGVVLIASKRYNSN